MFIARFGHLARLRKGSTSAVKYKQDLGGRVYFLLTSGFTLNTSKPSYTENNLVT